MSDTTEPTGQTTGQGELVLYASEDGSTTFFLRAQDGTVWLTQMELAELFQTSIRTRQRKQLVMADWRQYVDSFIQFNESPLLKGVGRMSHDTMLKIVHGRYEEFDEQRRKVEAIEADSVDMQELEQAEKRLSKKGARDAS